MFHKPYQAAIQIISSLRLGIHPAGRTLSEEDPLESWLATRQVMMSQLKYFMMYRCSVELTSRASPSFPIWLVKT